jgi:hypothetical protein
LSSLSSNTIVYKGLLTPEQVDAFYEDLQDEDFVSAFALVHSRFSTNTFPSWERAHPNRYLIHNGEINTLRGNMNWMKAREQQFVSEAFGEDLPKVLPILDENGSDSSILDNAFEFFVLAGRNPAHAGNDADSGAVEREPVHVKRKEGILRISQLFNGAMGRPDCDFIYKRKTDRSHFRPERAQTRSLLCH